MVSLAASDWISAHDLIRRWNNDRKNVLVLQIHLYLASHRIVLRHARLAIEMQRFNDFVLGNIHNRFRLTPLVRDIELVERRGVSTAVGLLLRLATS